MEEIKQKEQTETPIPGWPGMTEEALEREAEEIEHDEFAQVDGMWVIPIGPVSGLNDEDPSDWPESISVTPVELERLQDEADRRQISVRTLLEQRIAKDPSG